MRCHTKVKPYECDLCDMKFTQRGNLQKHKEIHEGIKRFTCDHCGNKYSKKYNLMVHQNSVKRKELL
jgi:KRAB domain-containing zinc finger protein